jgi:probable HAF family extracellular repeat protein
METPLSTAVGGRLVSVYLAVTTALTVFTFVVVTASARADEFLGLGILPGGTFSQALGISADGLVVVGLSTSTAGPNGEAFRWTSGTGMVGLGFLPGYTNSSALAASTDGSVVVGDVAGFGSNQAFIWTGGVMSGLGFLPGGTRSNAFGVNADGSVVVGSGDSPGGNRAFRWTGGVMNSLGVLPGGTYSEAYGVNADGSVVVGYGSSTAVPGGEAFRWTQSGGISGLGVMLGGTFSVAQAVNAAGSVVVGYGDSTVVPSGEAFRWTSGTGMIGLGVLPGGTFSQALAVNADGSVVVGNSTSTAVPSGDAFRWTQSSGMKSVKDLLVAGGVNMAGWTLSSAQGVSADGTVIVGVGGNPSNAGEAWLARFSPVFGAGIITPGVVAQSFSGQAAMGKTANAAIGGTLGTMNEYATQAKQTQGARKTPFSVFGYGAYDSDPVASGLLGMTVDLPREIVIGATIGANAIKTDMVFNGSAKLSGGSAGAFVARVPDAGLQWLIGIGGTAITGDVSRGYLNGNDPAYSKGNTSGRGVGATARLGWAFKDLVPKTQLTPFASYIIATTSFDGYIETGGPFPAQLAAFTSTAQTSRLGADARYTFAPGRWLWGTAAWAHRLDGGKSPDISGTLIGLFSMTAPGISSAKDWAELTGGVRLPVWNNGAVTASVTTSLVPHQPTTYVARLGVTQAF